jgi:hypothetical protein
MAKKPAGEAVRLTIYLPKETHKALRILAIQEEVSTTKLVEALIDKRLKQRRGGGKA